MYGNLQILSSISGLIPTHSNNMKVVFGDMTESPLLPPSERGKVWREHISRYAVSTSYGKIFHKAVSILNQEEQQRAMSFHHANDSLLYAVAHSLLRLELSRKYPDVRPDSWKFRTNKFGKPFIHNKYIKLWFSLSHSWPWIAVAFSDSGKCGVDIEKIQQSLDWNAIACASFHPDEYAQIRSSDTPIYHFLRLWTIKESICKFIGCGMPIGFPELHISKDMKHANFRKHNLPVYIISLSDTDYVLSACCSNTKDEACVLQKTDLLALYL